MTTEVVHLAPAKVARITGGLYLAYILASVLATGQRGDHGAVTHAGTVFPPNKRLHPARSAPLQEHHA